MSGPRVLLFGGLDPTGGAGLFADLEALSAVGASGWGMATALTAQGPRGARSAEPVALATLSAQLRSLLDGARERPRAAKTGMLGTAAHAAALARWLSRPPLSRLPLVVDPVLRASSGLALFDAGRRSAGRALQPLLERATLATPNWPELELLAGRSLGSEEEAVRAARELPSRAVLVKGGHLPGAEAVDVLADRDRVLTLRAARIDTPHTHGTGCTYSAAIAARLARGDDLADAVRTAHAWVQRAIATAPGLGRGHGPLNHWARS